MQVATAQKIEQAESAEQTSYDEVPYQSHPFPLTHPRHLALVASLFGLNPPPFEKARILEIGCAAGGNLVPVAMLHPQTTCVGFDLSSRQIEDGRKEIKALGLKNIRLEALSVTDITADFGTFDYVICHGVFSWVPAEVRDHILRVCKENLSPSGVAYISYNTLPGWNALKSLREMMIYHAAQFDTPARKVQESLNLLRFVRTNTAQNNSPWSKMLEQEVAHLEQQNPWYIFHEHLESENHAFYLHDFVSMAEKYGLRYLGDAQIPTMFVGTMGQEVAKSLSSLKDIVREEQYMDFLRNRRFRATLLVQGEQKPNYSISPERVLDFALTPVSIAPDFDAATTDWTRDDKRTFGGGAVTAIKGVSALLLYTLHQNGDTPLAAQDLIDRVAALLPAIDRQEVAARLVEIGLMLAFHGRIDLHGAFYPREAKGISETPEVWSYARRQALETHTLTSLHHKVVPVDAALQLYAILFDGTRRIDDAVEIFLQEIDKRGGQLNRKDGSVITDPDEKRASALELAQASLGQFLKNHLLVA